MTGVAASAAAPVLRVEKPGSRVYPAAMTEETAGAEELATETAAKAAALAALAGTADSSAFTGWGTGIIRWKRQHQQQYRRVGCTPRTAVLFHQRRERQQQGRRHSWWQWQHRQQYPRREQRTPVGEVFPQGWRRKQLGQRHWQRMRQHKPQHRRQERPLPAAVYSTSASGENSWNAGTIQRERQHEQ